MFSWGTFTKCWALFYSVPTLRISGRPQPHAAVPPPVGLAVHPPDCLAALPRVCVIVAAAVCPAPRGPAAVGGLQVRAGVRRGPVSTRVLQGECTFCSSKQNCAVLAGGSVGWSVALCTQRCQVQFPVRAHAWDTGSISSRGASGRQLIHISLSH